jgi:hypothetical protein
LCQTASRELFESAPRDRDRLNKHVVRAANARSCRRGARVSEARGRRPRARSPHPTCCAAPPLCAQRWPVALSTEPVCVPCRHDGKRRPTEHPLRKSPAKGVCGEGQNRTGDTWFFSRLFKENRDLRLKSRAIAIGCALGQLVQPSAISTTAR